MPTVSHPDEEIDKIYEQIEAILDKVKYKDNLIIMKDFNVVVGAGKDEEILWKEC